MNALGEHIVVYKPVGKTPLRVIEELKMLNPHYREKKISYAGRLDPMAEGILLLLICDENKRRKEYEGLEKVYESEIALGISTDTYDGLGLIQGIRLESVRIKDVEDALEKMIGKQDQSYPPFSSKPVNGHPLYWWARENRLAEISLPSKKIKIDEIKKISEENIAIKDLVKNNLQKISKIQGNFRQEEIKKTWAELEQKHQKELVVIVGIRVRCSSGTYVRGIANALGEALGVGAFAYSIKRIQVGKYLIKDCLEMLPKKPLL